MQGFYDDPMCYRNPNSRINHKHRKITYDFCHFSKNIKSLLISHFIIMNHCEISLFVMFILEINYG